LAKRQWGLLDRFGVFLRFDTAWVVSRQSVSTKKINSR